MRDALASGATLRGLRLAGALAGPITGNVAHPVRLVPPVWRTSHWQRLGHQPVQRDLQHVAASTGAVVDVHEVQTDEERRRFEQGKMRQAARLARAKE